MTDLIKPRPWNGRPLKGEWLVTDKLDGVRAVRLANGQVVSRGGKALHGLDEAFALTGLTDVEVFLGDWEATVSAVRSFNGALVDPSCLYSLSPLDERLLQAAVTDPSAAMIKELMEVAVQERNVEGIVLRQGNLWIKVKPVETIDLEVVEILPGKGKHEGRMGALVTAAGKVGQGFTDAEREQEWRPGMVIEVAYRTLTPSGKLKEGRYLRRREDKET